MAALTLTAEQDLGDSLWLPRSTTSAPLNACTEAEWSAFKKPGRCKNLWHLFRAPTKASKELETFSFGQEVPKRRECAKQESAKEEGPARREGQNGQ